MPRAQLVWRAISVPQGALTDENGARGGQRVGLPTVVTVRGVNRGRSTLEFEVGAGLAATHRLNVDARGGQTGLATRVRLSVADEDSLAETTDLTVELIDASGLYASDFDGVIDLTASDPWLFIHEGPMARIGPDAGGTLTRTVSRPSGPRGLAVLVRATVTSTALPGTLTSTLALPVLEVD